MSSPTQAPQQDTPLTVTPSPLNMPGAQAAQLNMNPPIQTMHAPTEMPVSNGNKTNADKPPEGDAVNLDELNAKYKGVQELARKFETTAKENHDKAEAYDKLLSALSGNGETPVADPMIEIAKLRADVETERVERLRSEVARITGVPPTLIAGNDADSMSASAKEALEWGQGLGTKQTGVPLVAPATTVNSDGKPGDGKPNQIQTRDELKNMKSSEIMAAYNEGRMDKLLGKPT